MLTAPPRIVIVGAGDHGRVVLELLRAAGEAPLGFVEPRRSPGVADRTIDELPVMGDLQDDLGWRGAGSLRVVCALGDNRARAAAYERCLALGLTPAACIHPTATLLTGATIEPGAMVCAGAIVGVAARVGPNAIVNTAASVDHDNWIGAHATVAPGAHLAGRVVVGEGAYVGIGAAVREGTRIGDWALVAGGAMVARDVPDGARVAGVPARAMAEPVAR
jgi:sugar O-acyltransferase (sialic acid O-acetyltransferase NeuD family)